MEVDDSQLAGMGLHAKRAILDECVPWSEWDRKKDIHDIVKAQVGTTDKPSADEWFRTEKGATNSNAVRCNVCIYVIKIQATVIAGNSDGSDKAIDDEYYLCKKETGDWAVKNLVTSGGATKNASHLRHAADPKTYSISRYMDYIPIDLINTTDKYITLFVNKHKTDNANLTKRMCTLSFVSFKCDLEMDEDGFIDEHYRDVHNIPGVPAMRPLQEIEVNAKLDFVIADLTDLEISGPDKQNAKIESIYTRCVARGVITKSYNKSCADLMASKSQDFMIELSKRTNTNFFKRFQMHLSTALGLDVSTDFTCKWSVIEKSLIKAMSAEQSTVRYAKFLETGYTTFHTMPMELIIDTIDKHIDNALGKAAAATPDYIYNMRKKYDLIFDVARHLPNDFKIIREYVMQHCTKMHDRLIEIMDIIKFQEHLVAIFETKGVLLQFKNDDIPAQKKQQVSVNETKIKKRKE